MAEKKKKPKYVEKADEVTKKVDKAVSDAVSSVVKKRDYSRPNPASKQKVGPAPKRDYSRPNPASKQKVGPAPKRDYSRPNPATKKAPVDPVKKDKPKGSHGLARPEAPGSYPKAKRYGSNSPKNTDKGTGFGGEPKATAPKAGSIGRKSPKNDDYGTRKPPSNPGSAGKTKQPVKAGQDPNAEWRRAQLTGQGDRWDATRGKKKREGSNR